MRPTPQSIVRFFQKSRKRHLFLTGSRHSGKSTLLAQIAVCMNGNLSDGHSPDSAPGVLPGITTRGVPGQHVLLTDNETGRSMVIGEFDRTLSGPGNQMRPVAEGFSEVGIPALKRLAFGSGSARSAGGDDTSCSPFGDRVWIDEIGYLEEGCPAYCNALEYLLDHRPVCGVLRGQDTPFLKKLKARKDIFLYDLDKPLPAVGCILMASGTGRRFGSNKLLADFGGQPLISRILAATDTEPPIKRIAVTRHRQIADLCEQAGITAVLHDLPCRSDTIRLGLEALGTILPDASGCMFCPCDQPLLSKETMEKLICRFMGQPDYIHRLSYAHTQGSPVIFPKHCFHELMTLPADKGGSFVIRLHPEEVRFAEASSEWELRDADTKEELALLQKMAEHF